MHDLNLFLISAFHPIKLISQKNSTLKIQNSMFPISIQMCVKVLLLKLHIPSTNLLYATCINPPTPIGGHPIH
jgi:hypothetical protein